MNPKANIVSQAFYSVLLCWKYILGIVFVLYVMDGINVVYDIGNSMQVTKAFAESGIIFYLCLSLLGLDAKLKENSKKYIWFSLRYILLIYAPVIIVSILVVILAVSALQGERPDTEFLLGLTIPCGAVISFLTMFLFGTAFPSQLFDVRPGIGAAIGRAFRQAGYLVPRLFFGVGFFAALSFAILILSENLGIGSDPITSAGTPDPAGALVLALVKLTSAFSLAVFAVVVCRAYLKDLQERGELPASDAEIFA
ncbi:hypothetical protein [Roseibium marinum]|uniref:Uncharacterized protein n=1 Tax=Roseibium marinum TaxID=281252 RepID=A0A2S3ULN8_9HYPH|nr:hypothetical protein [Roseibium marinum]POF28480.1 hypothetical protein CLV41_11343 [Roseibium marinum]